MPTHKFTVRRTSDNAFLIHVHSEEKPPEFSDEQWQRDMASIAAFIAASLCPIEGRFEAFAEGAEEEPLASRSFEEAAQTPTWHADPAAVRQAAAQTMLAYNFPAALVRYVTGVENAPSEAQ